MTMTVLEKPSKPERPPRRKKQPRPLSSGGTSPQARRQAAAILEVLAGVRRPSEAAQALGTSLPRYYQLERRALLGLLAACEPAPRGPRVDVARRIAALERENRRLLRECDRQQALVRGVERSLGLAQVVAGKAPAKGKEGSSPPAANGKRRRKRRPSVRALKALKGLRVEDDPDKASSDAATGVTEVSV
jgi:hypothetical protein